MTIVQSNQEWVAIILFVLGIKLLLDVRTFLDEEGNTLRSTDLASIEEGGALHISLFRKASALSPSTRHEVNVFAVGFL
eukprot:CAMPEP_0201537228 /NCGR_PEP_ID=MMETSP0161_2-20130828/64140_1 /ASSEMBLY_ACC=CAM_ASM_000251 /TAXON_ID=180227 /ORGANISM="Neoparamoeba aestuarina, Strain SoJaBio B1-5/56/2" /LENGTH=78 /DNA_ID=CAMNT_0047943389 /DNA_START=23 /DNA_END=256 /DNA_ORIENTATION=-